MSTQGPDVKEGTLNPRSRTALEWLSAAAFDPRVCEWHWRQDELGTQLLPAGRLWDVLMFPLQPGLLVLGALLRGAAKPGPALADFVSDQVGFFVPPRVMGRWTDTGSRLAGPGTWIVVPLPGRHVRGIQWLCPPDGQGTLNDPEALKAAIRSSAPSSTGVPAQAARHPCDDPQAPGWSGPHTSYLPTPRPDGRISSASLRTRMMPSR